MDIYSIGSAVCHQIPERTFLIGGMALPFCARCSGIYLGLIVTYLFLCLKGRGKEKGWPFRPIFIFCLSFLALMGLESIGSFLHLWTTSNEIRFLTGLFTGMSLTLFLTPLLNSVLWAENGGRSALIEWKEFARLNLILLTFALFVEGKPAPLFYPFAYLTLAGAATLFIGVNLLVIVIVFGKEKRAKKFRELILFLIPAVLLFWGEVQFLIFVHHFLPSI